MENSPSESDANLSGDSDSGLVNSVYSELRVLARQKMRGEAPQTLSATSLVHEAWLRITEDGKLNQEEWKNRRHFFGAAAEAMRRILIDRGRAKQALKRGGDLERDDLAISKIAASVDETPNTVAVCEALENFAKVDAECAELVKLKFFVGMSWEEIAELTGESTRTVNRRWTYAKAWLYDAIERKRG